jgi:hypothetical protein
MMLELHAGDCLAFLARALVVRGLPLLDAHGLDLGGTSTLLFRDCVRITSSVVDRLSLDADRRPIALWLRAAFFALFDEVSAADCWRLAFSGIL